MSIMLNDVKLLFADYRVLCVSSVRYSKSFDQHINKGAYSRVGAPTLRP
ncbi:hypothetical protein GA0071314_1086 [Halomonas sp. HL-93]|nr:hypothetical protein GA0071314_1086 [Halomonas sp. HL-93]